MATKTKKAVWKPTHFPARIDLEWSISRSRDCDGCNRVTVYGDGEKLESSMGGGYDMTGQALRLWLDEAYPTELLPFAWMARRWQNDMYDSLKYITAPNGKILTLAGRSAPDFLTYANFDVNTDEVLSVGVADNRDQFPYIMQLLGITASQFLRKEKVAGWVLTQEPNENAQRWIDQCAKIHRTHKPNAKSALRLTEWRFGQETHRTYVKYGKFLDLFDNAEETIQDVADGWGVEGYIGYNERSPRSKGFDTWTVSREKWDMKGEHSWEFLDKHSYYSNSLDFIQAHLIEVAEEK